MISLYQNNLMSSSKEKTDHNSCSKLSFDQYIEHISNENVQKYIQQMNVLEKKTLKIAYEHLETSFDIEKSIGFKNYMSESK